MNAKFKITYLLLFATLIAPLACKKYPEKIIGNWRLEKIKYPREAIHGHFLILEFLSDKTFYIKDVNSLTIKERGHWKISKKNLELNFDDGRKGNYEIKKLTGEELVLFYNAGGLDKSEIYKKTD